MTSDSTDSLVESFFRHESANLLAVLTRAFGFQLFDVIEEMVQEAMAEALRAWRINGVPDNPAGWLHRVARNRIIDALRREKTGEQVVERHSAQKSYDQSISFEADELQDSLLRMVFACCHPSLERPSQLALTLKVLCGLGDHEIARGLLMTPTAIKKRVTRSKRHLQLNQVSMELPEPDSLQKRLETVHDVLYLMFNEGYSATRGDLPIRIDLCEEAARLCHLLCESELASPTTYALLSLMLFHSARFRSRMSNEGAVVLLADQDRKTWDGKMIKVAEYWLARSAAGRTISKFHLEAGIARIHCSAESVESTNWTGIVRHYDLLIQMGDSPIYQLNRAVALGQAGQHAQALSILHDLRRTPQLASYPLLDCALANLMTTVGNYDQAKSHWNAALEKTQGSHDRQLIQNRIEALQIVETEES